MPHLPHMWALLWAAAGATPPRVHGFPREPTASAGTVATALTAHGSMGGAIAAAVLHRVVRAFSDLRQLRSLLESLSAALREGCGGGVGTCDGAVLGRLLCRGEVLAAVRQAAASAPPGESFFERQRQSALQTYTHLEGPCCASLPWLSPSQLTLDQTK